jgi:hypothetical protein
LELFWEDNVARGGITGFGLAWQFLLPNKMLDPAEWRADHRENPRG